jgi:hypothetical protein
VKNLPGLEPLRFAIGAPTRFSSRNAQGELSPAMTCARALRTASWHRTGPMIFGAWRTAILISALNAVALAVRIHAEEEALDRAESGRLFRSVTGHHLRGEVDRRLRLG